MKRMGASDQLGKLKHKARERASETRERTLHGEEQNRMRMASLRESRDSAPGSISSQHTCTITCTAAPRVCHFSAFHFKGFDDIWGTIL